MKIPVSHGHLEANLQEPSAPPPRGGAVFCHPHPLHGGTMHTKAVYRAAQALSIAGLRVLRFNFRGVGCSTGSFDDGIGELDDVRAAVDWLALGLPGKPLVAGGVSFGSLMALRFGVQDPRVVALVAVGAPIRVYDYSFLARTSKPVLVVQGEHDPFGSPSEVREALEPLGAGITVVGVPGAGHLFQDHIRQLQAVLQAFFGEGRGGEALEQALLRSPTRPSP